MTNEGRNKNTTVMDRGVPSSLRLFKVGIGNRQLVDFCKGCHGVSKNMKFLVLVFLLLSLACPSFGVSTKPNILLIVADDLGWNDIGYNNPDIISPHIDGLAKEGITLQQSYVQPVCSPSRASLLTGYYSFRLGLQHLVILSMQPVCLPLDKLIFPQLLMTHGYAAHMVGKWHLGFCDWECTPTYRGFDSFYGYYTGSEDYYEKTTDGIFDFRFNETLCTEARGNYSTFQYTDRAVDIINGHNPDEPLFLYLAYQNIHFPLKAPEEYINLYPNINRTERKTASASVTALDDSVGAVVAALKDQGLYNNTLIVFTADNGGYTPAGGNNFPLRGGKLSIFEGGTRVPGFIHGPMLERSGVNHEGMMHIVDWFPTLAEAAGIPYYNPDQDGVSQWTSLNTGGPSPRNEFVYNIDLHIAPVGGRAGIRVGDYKLLQGCPGFYPGWYRPEDEDQGFDFELSILSNTERLLELIDMFYPNGSRLLFNLKDDPYEENNLYDQMPDIVTQLQNRLNEHKKKYVEVMYPPEMNATGIHAYSPGWCSLS